MPWEPVPIAETVAALQQDIAYIVTHTSVMVHSNREELRRHVNTPRRQIVPRGKATYADGTTVEFQDVGAPQPGLPTALITDLVADVVNTATALGLGIPS